MKIKHCCNMKQNSSYNVLKFYCKVFFYWFNNNLINWFAMPRTMFVLEDIQVILKDTFKKIFFRRKILSRMHFVTPCFKTKTFFRTLQTASCSLWLIILRLLCHFLRPRSSLYPWNITLRKTFIHVFHGCVWHRSSFRTNSILREA